ncbi:MAG: orotate phosphoribosyltransferase [Bacteroidota bacterium]
MILNKETALKIAKSLLQIKAIILQPANPFTWASGWKSPIYCDNRKILSYTDIRTYIRQQLAVAIFEKYGKPDVIAGVATAGIAHGVLAAEQLGLPFVYVRTDDKKHGLKKRIEGNVQPGQSIVVVEDLISTGKSSINAVKALKEADCIVKGMVAIFTYGFKVASDNFNKAKCPLVTLCNYEILIQQALQSGYINDKELTVLKSWREDPGNWKWTLKV